MISKEKQKNMQPEINIGLIGHVDHGKTTLTESLSGKWTDTHSEELKRGITIRLGYANASFYKCKECLDSECYCPQNKCQKCNKGAEFVKKVSFVDAPGHETLMATMLSGAAIMDAALLVIAANEPCPQPQTKEHLMALNIIGVKDIIIVQNKIDLVNKEKALQNYNQIKEFVKSTIAEEAPIIPVSAQHNINISILIKTIIERFKTPKRDSKKNPLFLIARSFDINKPGTQIDHLVGGVLGGSLKQGILKLNDEIEIRPGLKREKEGKVLWESVFTKIVSIHSGNDSIEEANPGGSIGILTKLDPSIVKADSLTGSIAGHKNKLPSIMHTLSLEPHLMERIVGAKDNLVTEPIKKGEILMLNVNAAATVGTVTELKKNLTHIKLKIPICAQIEDRITLSRRLGNRWRLIGYGIIKD